MYKYVVKRLIFLIPIILGVSFIVFGVLSLTPSSPGRIILGITATQEAVDLKNHQLGYDRPFFVRYFSYIGGALQGDFGRSYQSDVPVFGEILPRFPTTVRIAILGVGTAALLGIPLGILSAVKQYSAIDVISTTGALMLASIPGFWLGLMLMLLFAQKLGWLPVSGAGTWQHYVLPTITIGLPGCAGIMRLTRSTMLETIRQDYIRTARAKGASESRVIWGHALKNALLPVITSLGMSFGGMLGGTILTETVFAIPGLGTLTITAIRAKNIPVVMGSALFLAVLFCLILLVVDLIYAFIDPRIKSQYLK
jgi:peptide/nickel transport system permease protein